MLESSHKQAITDCYLLAREVARIGTASVWQPAVIRGRRVRVSIQTRERNPNPNFLVRISSGRVGVKNVKGWGPKSSVCPSKPGKPNFSGGISRDFADIPELPEKFEKKVSVQFLAPKYEEHGSGLMCDCDCP